MAVWVWKLEELPWRWLALGLLHLSHLEWVAQELARVWAELASPCNQRSWKTLLSSLRRRRAWFSQFCLALPQPPC